VGIGLLSLSPAFGSGYFAAFILAPPFRFSEKNHFPVDLRVPVRVCSLGVALPEGYGQHVVDGRRHVSEASMRLPDDRLAGQ